jgi:hypothetical protein
MEHQEDAAAAHATERDAQDNMHMDDINIPLVAVSVAFFGVLLAVSIVALQAWFYHQQTGIREEQRLVRDDIQTELGKLWHKQRLELHDPAKAESRDPVPAPGSTAPVTLPAKKRITIDEAIASMVKDKK